MGILVNDELADETQFNWQVVILNRTTIFYHPVFKGYFRTNLVFLCYDF